MPVPILKIKTYPDPLLKNKAKKVAVITDVEKKLFSDMAETMYLNQGIGLAATQVGVDKQLVVIDVGEGLVKIANPVIMKRIGWGCIEEGCLSVPGVQVKIKRAQRILIQFLNEEGEIVTCEVNGLYARALQHEMDHLFGKLIVDYLNPIKRLFISKNYKKRVDKTKNL